MVTSLNEICCPKFDPQPWDRKEVVWNNKKFVKDRVRCLFHIPLNFGAVMRRNMARIEASQAKSEQGLVLAEDNSLWGADVYIHVDGDVPDSRMTTLSGTFMSKVYEGPYKDVGRWIKDMQQYVRDSGKHVKRLLTFYTTCPKCAKKYGRNYVVLLAEI